MKRFLKYDAFDICNYFIFQEKSLLEDTCGGRRIILPLSFPWWVPFTEQTTNFVSVIAMATYNSHSGGWVGFLMAHDMLCYNFSWPLPTSDKSGIHFCSWSTIRADFVSPSGRVIIRTMVGWGDLRFNVGSEPRCGLVYFTFPKYYHWQKWRLQSVSGNVHIRKGIEIRDLWMSVQFFTSKLPGPPTITIIELW
jgi:hypothetical protein